MQLSFWKFWLGLISKRGEKWYKYDIVKKRNVYANYAIILAAGKDAHVNQICLGSSQGCWDLYVGTCFP